MAVRSSPIGGVPGAFYVQPGLPSYIGYGDLMRLALARQLGMSESDVQDLQKQALYRLLNYDPGSQVPPSGLTKTWAELIAEKGGGDTARGIQQHILDPLAKLMEPYQNIFDTMDAAARARAITRSGSGVAPGSPVLDQTILGEREGRRMGVTSQIMGGLLGSEYQRTGQYNAAALNNWYRNNALQLQALQNVLSALMSPFNMAYGHAQQSNVAGQVVRQPASGVSLMPGHNWFGAPGTGMLGLNESSKDKGGPGGSEDTSKDSGTSTTTATGGTTGSGEQTAWWMEPVRRMMGGVVA